MINAPPFEPPDQEGFPTAESMKRFYDVLTKICREAMLVIAKLDAARRVLVGRLTTDRHSHVAVWRILSSVFDAAPGDEDKGLRDSDIANACPYACNDAYLRWLGGEIESVSCVTSEED